MKKKKKICTLLPLLVAFTLLFGIWGQKAEALVIQKNTGDKYTEYIGLTGVFNGRNAPFRLLVPDNWNNKLLIYARGTGSGIMLKQVLDEDGQPIIDENGQPLTEPIIDDESQIPIVGLTPLNNRPGSIPGNNDATLQMESKLLEIGYAIAASDYKPDDRFINQRGCNSII